MSLLIQIEAPVTVAVDVFGRSVACILCSMCCPHSNINYALKGGGDQMGQKPNCERCCIFKPQHSWVVSSDASCLSLNP